MFGVQSGLCGCEVKLQNVIEFVGACGIFFHFLLKFTVIRHF